MTGKGETYRSHITAYRKIQRTTVRMDADLWLEFKKETKSLNLTTCLVVRALVKQWIEAVRSKSRHTKMKNGKEPAGISRTKHEEQWQWIYHKDSMALYRFPASFVFAPRATTPNAATRALPPNLYRGKITNL